MRKVFFNILVVSQVVGAMQNRCINQTMFGLFKAIDNRINSILGKVCSIQVQDNQTNIIIMSTADVIIGELDSCCEFLSSQIDTIQGDNIDSCCEALSAQIDSCCESLSNQINSLTQGNIDSCCDHLSSQIDTIQGGNIDSCCEALSAQIDSCCEQLSSQIDMLGTGTVSCEPTPVTSATTISEPGKYCMANDIDGNIAITADAAIFDMNGHTLTTTSGNGFTITGDKVEVTKGRLVGTGGVIGISVSGATGFRLRDLEINDFTDGIELTAFASEGMIENCNIFSCSSSGIEYVDCNSIITKNVMVTGPTNFGFHLIHTSDIENLEFDSCQARGCGQGFFQQPTMAVLTNLIIRNCESSNNSGNGFGLNRTQNFIIRDCIASQNGFNGFFLGGTGAFPLFGTVKGCVATLNGVNGFMNEASSNVLFMTNQAYSNGVGYSILLPALAYNNYAAGNTTNFSGSGVTVTLVSTSVSTDTGWWTNVARA